MKYDDKRALELLRIGSGVPDAEFREDQEEAIRHVVEGRGKLLVVQKTGWGKSFVYFIATKLLREAGAGPSLLISPLLSLMRNQIAAAERMGVKAATINSNNTRDWDTVIAQARNDEIDILLISPERLANDDFRENFLPVMARRVAMLVIDEAHCISDWGHDFRPDYRRIERIVQTLPPNVQVIGTTATANNRVMEDLIEVLGPNIQVKRGDLDRPSLLLQTIQTPRKTDRLAWLAERLPEIPGSGIIYTLTKRDANQVARWLQSQGLDVEAYTSDSKNREELEQALLENRVKALVATVTLGMGYDKPDLSFVIHYQMPGSVVFYYQQVGRAGRGVDVAYGVLLSGAEDTDINNFFINSAFPTRSEVEQVLAALRAAPKGLSEAEILARTNIKNGRLDRVTKLLSLESPAPIVNMSKGRYPLWQLVPVRLRSAFWERAERLTTLRYKEQTQMQEYLTLESGHMEFLIRALDGNTETIQQPDLPSLPITASREMTLKADEFLRSGVIIDPRTFKRQIFCQRGRALCQWGDDNFSQRIQLDKYTHNNFSDELVAASTQLIQKWNPRPAPVWVTCIPSRRHPTLVKNFAERLADQLGLPFKEVLLRTDNRPEQKGMANGIQQMRNVEGSLAIIQSNLIRRPVLLVDDMVDSRWTFTIAASLLRNNGCPAVFPFALADTSSGQSE